MKHDDARNVIVRALTTVAPDLDANVITDDADLRYVLELDSMDHLNVFVNIHEQTGVEVPERDYPQLVTVGDCVRYLASKEPGPAGTSGSPAGEAIT